jgi:hypothetical protein
MQRQDEPTARSDFHIGQKIKKAFYCALVFGFLSYGGSYRLVNTIVTTFSNSNEQLLDDMGQPSIKAIIIQMLIFFGIVLMFIL